MIKSFADPLTEKIFCGEDLTKKEATQLGDIRLDKAQELTDVSLEVVSAIFSTEEKAYQPIPPCVSSATLASPLVF